MPIMTKDNKSGAIIFKKTSQEQHIEDMESCIKTTMNTNIAILQELEKLNKNIESIIKLVDTSNE